jgi:hypothetical protein
MRLQDRMAGGEGSLIMKPTLAEVRARIALVRACLAPRLEQEPPAWVRGVFVGRDKFLVVGRIKPRRRMVAGVILIVGLIVVLVAERSTVWFWLKDKETREAITPLLTFATAVAAGVFALMRHFQTIAADRQRRITETFSKPLSI